MQVSKDGGHQSCRWPFRRWAIYGLAFCYPSLYAVRNHCATAERSLHNSEGSCLTCRHVGTEKRLVSTSLTKWSRQVVKVRSTKKYFRRGHRRNSSAVVVALKGRSEAQVVRTEASLALVGCFTKKKKVPSHRKMYKRGQTKWLVPKDSNRVNIFWKRHTERYIVLCIAL